MNSNAASKITNEPNFCPQSEPVKRKVYESHRKCGTPLMRRRCTPLLRNSNTDCTNEQLKSVSIYSKHVLIETLQGLKQSLEDQSAALKMNLL